MSQFRPPAPEIPSSSPALLTSRMNSPLPSAPALHTPSPPPPHQRREKLLDELLVTERRYVSDLEELQTYKTRLEEKGFLTEEACEEIFPNLDTLVHFQSRFLLELEIHAELAVEEQCLGGVFVRRGVEGWAGSYEAWVVGWDGACARVEEELGGGREVDGDSVDVEMLKGFVTKPVSRLCRYPLLLKELLAATPSHQHSTRVDLEGALDMLSTLLTRLLATTRATALESAHRELMTHVHDWKGHDATPFGALLLHEKECWVRVERHQEHEYPAYLFERILLAVKRDTRKKKAGTENIERSANSPEEWRLKGRIYVHSIRKIMAPVTGEAEKVLTLTWQSSEGLRTVTHLRFSTKEMRNVWADRLNRNVAAVRETEEAERRRQRRVVTRRARDVRVPPPLEEFGEGVQEEVVFGLDQRLISEVGWPLNESTEAVPISHSGEDLGNGGGDWLLRARPEGIPPAPGEEEGGRWPLGEDGIPIPLSPSREEEVVVDEEEEGDIPIAWPLRDSDSSGHSAQWTWI